MTSFGSLAKAKRVCDGDEVLKLSDGKWVRRIAWRQLSADSCELSYSTRPVNNYQRDGQMRIDGNGGSAPNFSREQSRRSHLGFQSSGGRGSAAWNTGHTEYPKSSRAGDFEQAGLLYRVMSEAVRARLVSNIADHLSKAGKEIQKRQVEHFRAADPEYGGRIAKALELEA